MDTGLFSVLRQLFEKKACHVAVCKGSVGTIEWNMIILAKSAELVVLYIVVRLIVRHVAPQLFIPFIPQLLKRSFCNIQRIIILPRCCCDVCTMFHNEAKIKSQIVPYDIVFPDKGDKRLCDTSEFGLVGYHFSMDAIYLLCLGRNTASRLAKRRELFNRLKSAESNSGNLYDLRLCWVKPGCLGVNYDEVPEFVTGRLFGDIGERQIIRFGYRTLWSHGIRNGYLCGRNGIKGRFKFCFFPGQSFFLFFSLPLLLLSFCLCFSLCSGFGLSFCLKHM